MVSRLGAGVSPAEKSRIISYDRSVLLQRMWLCLATAGLFIPSVYVRAMMIIMIGTLIYMQERTLGLLVPASPGFSYWVTSFLSYVVGGIGTAVLYDARNGFGTRYLDSALLYLGLGMASYVVGMMLAGNPNKDDKQRKSTSINIVFTTRSIVFFSGLFLLATIGMDIFRGSILGGLYYNLIIGALQSLEGLPPILLAFYLMQPGRKWRLALLLFSATFIVPFAGISIGYGRSKLLYAVLALLLIWISLKMHYQQRISRKAKLLILLAPIVATLFFGANTNYRVGVNLNSSLSIEERLQITQGSVSQIYHSSDLVMDTAGALVDRLIEKESLELIGRSEAGAIGQAGWTVRDLEQILFSWIPKTFYPQKGVGYGRDIMEYYGLCAPGNNIPATVLADAFRRSGVLGVVFLYFFMGLSSTAIATRLTQNWGILGILLAYYFAQLHLHLYTTDALYVFILYVYRLPSSALMIYALLRSSGILQVNRESK